MRIKLYENRDFMRRTQIKLMQEEVHIWCIRWKEVIPVFEYYQLMLDQKEKEKIHIFSPGNNRRKQAMQGFLCVCTKPEMVYRCN